jgi:hypothetical protein
MDGVHTSSFRELYHGTAASRVSSIRAIGLFPPETPRHPGFWAMLTSSWQDAAGNARKQPPGDRAVVMYLIPEDEADAYLYPSMAMGPNTWYTLRKPLPGSMIHRVDTQGIPELHQLSG